MKLASLLVCLLCVACDKPAPISKTKPVVNEVEDKSSFTPQVRLFISRCLDDKNFEFVNAQEWLLKQDISQPDKDQMWEIISGLVWNTDKARARTLAKNIQNKKQREEVLLWYDSTEKNILHPVKDN